MAKIAGTGELPGIEQALFNALPYGLDVTVPVAGSKQAQSNGLVEWSDPFAGDPVAEILHKGFALEARVGGREVGGILADRVPVVGKLPTAIVALSKLMSHEEVGSIANQGGSL